MVHVQIILKHRWFEEVACDLLSESHDTECNYVNGAICRLRVQTVQPRDNTVQRGVISGVGFSTLQLWLSGVVAATCLLTVALVPLS